MNSTLDEEDIMIEDTTTLAIKLANYYKQIHHQEKCEETKKKIF